MDAIPIEMKIVSCNFMIFSLAGLVLKGTTKVGSGRDLDLNFLTPIVRSPIKMIKMHTKIGTNTILKKVTCFIHKI